MSKERTLRLFTFCVDETEIAIRSSQIKRILRAWHLSASKPDGVPNFIKGIVEYENYRLPVSCFREQLDLRARKKRVERQNVCVVVIQIGQMMTGMIINQINELIEIPKGEFVKPFFHSFKTPLGGEILSEYIESIKPNGNPILILNWKKILLEATNHKSYIFKS